MAYLGYIPPTNWGDNEMDWDNPDPSERSYLDAIVRAITERYLILCQHGKIDQNPYYNYPYFARFRRESHMPCQLYTNAWADAIIAMVYVCIAAFVVENPDESTKAETPYVSVASIYADDPHHLDMNIGAGELVRSTRSKKFLKACKFFIEKCHIVEFTPLFLVDKYTGLADASGATSWSEAWSLFEAGEKTVVHDLQSNRPDGTFIVNHFQTYNQWRFSVNVRYIRVTDLAHTLILSLSESGGPTTNDLYFISWDYLNAGFAEGANDVAVPAGTEPLLIGDAVTAPHEPASYVSWYDGVDPDTRLDHYNTSYRATYKGAYADYGVDGGLLFR